LGDLPIMKKAVKIVIVNQEKELLFYLRDDKPNLSYPGWWDLIGGRVEKGERGIGEIKEEIECEIENIMELGKIVVKKQGLNLEDWGVKIFRGDINLSLKDIKLNEGQKLNYFKLEDIRKIKFPFYYNDFILANKDKIFL
jgi:8-oxo-dGTP diphosphatase